MGRGPVLPTTRDPEQRVKHRVYTTKPDLDQSHILHSQRLREYRYHTQNDAAEMHPKLS